MSGLEERERAVELYFTTPMTTAQVVEHLGYPTRQCLERWLAMDSRYAGHMAKPIIPLETRRRAVELVLGGMQQKQAAKQLGAGVGAVHGWVRAYRKGGMAALQPKNRNSAQGNKPADSRRRPSAADDDDAEALRRRVEEPEPENALMREVVEARRKRPRRRPAAPVEQGEDPVDRPVEAGVLARLDDMLARPARPGGRGVHRFRGRVRVPKGQGHAPNPRLGEGAPQPHAITCTVQAGENHTIITIDSTTRPPENAADAEDLIQPFHRGDDTRMANRPGHGLGLSIAKACTDAMQATLAVSRPSPGTFRTEIKLPNRPTQRHCPQQKEHGHRPHAGQ